MVWQPRAPLPTPTADQIVNPLPHVPASNQPGALGVSSQGGVPPLPAAPINNQLLPAGGVLLPLSAPINNELLPLAPFSGGPSHAGDVSRGGNPTADQAGGSGSSLATGSGMDIHKCEKCSDPGHLIENCPKLPCSRCSGTRHTAISCTTPIGPVCFQCCNIGHYMKDCVSVVYGTSCPTCGGAGHGDPANPNQSLVCASPVIILRCTSCPSTEHRPRDCPQRSAEYAGWRGSNVCQFCRVAGHNYPECPSLS